MVKITRRIKNNFLFVKNEKKERNIFMTFSSHTRSSWTHQTCQVDKKEALGSGGRCLSDKICDKKLTVCVVPFDKKHDMLCPSSEHNFLHIPKTSIVNFIPVCLKRWLYKISIYCVENLNAAIYRLSEVINLLIYSIYSNI